jgi:hypothetical protein
MIPLGFKKSLPNISIRGIYLNIQKQFLKLWGKTPDEIFKLLEEYEYEVFDYNGNLFNYKADRYSKISDFVAIQKSV